MNGPTFADIFAVMSAASFGRMSARVPIPAEPAEGDMPTQVAIALNVLLDDLAARTAALQRMQSRLAALSDAGVIGILVATLDGRVLEINDSLLRTLGYERDAIISGKVAWRSLTPHEWREVDESAIASLRATGSAIREKEYFHAGGARVPVVIGTTLLPGPTEETISFVLDLTGNQLAAQAVEHLREARASEAMFRGLLEAAPDAVVIVGTDGRVVLSNGQSERLFGYTRAELLGQHVEMLIPARFRERHPGHREGYFAAPQTRAIRSGLELFGLRKDGSEFPVEISLGMLETERGVLVSSAIRDITERKATETALKHANRELEAFSYSVAHDLRAPLRGINGFAQLVLDTQASSLDEDGRSWLQEIVAGSENMAGLIDGLLSLARVSRGELRVEPIDLSALAHEVIAELALGAPERVVTVRIAPDLRADMDARLARSLLMNVLGNAWKFTSKSIAPVIELGIAREGERDAFFVRDNGAGFDNAFASKLFAPFQRLHSPGEFPGTGVGLATVQRIVQRHGGRIWAEGVVGKGATFHFDIAVRASGENE